jgi:Fe-S-cluster-containing hydrogenase component 2/CRP-like cAMP-binding protein
VDHDACILCDRCIRACNEVRHNYVIGRSGKGYDAKIAFDLNDPMGSSSCVSCGECMVSCPTGALTNKVVIPAELPDGEPVEVRFLKGLPYFADISSTFLQLNRNAVVLRRFSPGEIVCREGDYGSTAFLILEGRAEMFLHPRVNPPSGKPATGRSFKKWLSFVSGESVELSEQPLGIGHPSVGSVELGPGDLFAEGSCVSHYPRSETVRAVTACVTLEILRNVLDTMLARNGEFRKLLDGNFRQRAMRAHLLSTPLFSGVSEASIDRLKDIAQLVSVARAEVIFEEGSPADCFYVVRSGFAKLRAKRAGGEVVLAYIGPRQTLGFDAGPSRTAAATALERMDLIRFDRREVDELLGASGEDRERFAVRSERPDNPGPAHIALERFLDTGLMSAGSVLILDLERCTRCDACVRACAEAHEGVTRLVREGVRFDKYLVATSCRQCRDPLCMAGCPVGSIRRRTSLEIVIEDWCIGCGLCADNCPYGNIHMHPVQPAEGSLSGLIAARPAVKQKATACDLCSDLAEPSCVYACPHDAAKRVDAASFFGLLPQ